MRAFRGPVTGYAGRTLSQVCLGRVDGFDQYHGAGEAHEGSVAGGGLVAPHGGVLEFSDGLFDAGPRR
jgi:hypothetical protein